MFLARLLDGRSPETQPHSASRSNGDAASKVTPGDTVDLPPENRGPVASSSLDERDALGSTDEALLRSAEDLRESRSRWGSAPVQRGFHTPPNSVT